ncbi:MAG: diguanylate cyclase [Anaerolineales bacterium]|nr:diguanylate cyclase [Anaerolineales bacterium]
MTAISVVWILLISSMLLAGLTILLRRYVNMSASAPRKQAEEALIESEKRFRTLIEAAPVGVVLTRNARIVYANHTFLEMFGETMESIIGTPTIEKVAPESHKEFTKNIQRQAQGEKVRYEIFGLRKDGASFPIQVVSTRITGFSEELTALGFVQDISERRQAEEILRTQNARLNTLHTITLDLLNHRKVEDMLNAILTRACELLDSPFGLIGLIEGNELVAHASTDLNASLLGLRVALTETHLSNLTIQTGQPQAIQDYSQWEKRLKLYDPFKLKSVANIPIVINENIVGVIVLGRIEKDKPFTSDEIEVMKSFAEMAALAMDNARLFDSAQHELAEKIRAEEELQRANKKLKLQLDKIKSLQIELREQAVRDPLTGLYNRRYLNEILLRELARAEREKSVISFVMIDLDHFKNVNDSFGHATGDKILQKLAAQLLSHTRSGDIVCRYGGEEFLVILPNVSAEISLQIAEKLRGLFETPGALFENVEINTTISCGIAEYPSDGLTAEEIISNADKALYAAKRMGRNRVIVWSEAKNEVHE